MKQIFPEVPIEVSARHVHLSAEDLATLFGSGAELHPERPISQPNQFLTKERVTLRGPNGLFERVAIVGPARPATQVELTLTDCRALGIEAPVALSGDKVPFRGQLILEGPVGKIALSENVIVAQRHLHLEPARAEEWGLHHLDRAIVETHGTRRLIFHDVVVRSQPGVDALSFMIDTDEANAAGVKTGDTANLIFPQNLTI